MLDFERILLVSAHPDDSEFGAGGTVARLKRENPECGWIGGVMHKRFPHHILGGVAGKETSMESGIASPVIKLIFNEPLPIGQKEEWIYRYNFLREYWKKYYDSNFVAQFKGYSKDFHYDYGWYTPVEEELLKRRKVGDGVFEVCLTYHVWMIRPEIIRAGIKFRTAPWETGIQFEHDMAKVGYKMCCDANIYIKHISIDGKIYRTDLFSSSNLDDFEIVYKELQEKGEGVYATKEWKEAHPEIARKIEEKKQKEEKDRQKLIEEKKSQPVTYPLREPRQGPHP